MGLICEGHYPQMVFQEGKRMLWNPISRKPYVNRPEERVRLRTVEYLVSEAEWSKNRISFELPVRLDHTSSKKRADLVCYTANVEPFLLVECKAEQIHTGQQAAEQIARYGTSIHTKWWLITNGLNDHWFRIHPQQKPQLHHEVPAPFQSKIPNANRPMSYWQKRGFVGTEQLHTSDYWLLEILQQWFLIKQSQVQYLQFRSTPFSYPLSHYYYITGVETAPSYQAALTFIQSADGATFLTAVFNVEAQLKGALSINIRNLMETDSPECHLFSGGSMKTIPFPPELILPKEVENQSKDFGILPEVLTDFFIQHR